MSWEKSATWNFRDEANYAFLEQKYKDRERLGAAADAARKLADKSQTIDGKPNPLHRWLDTQADMAQLRLEMSYIIDRNGQLQQYIETLEYLHNRVGLLEGAYGHTKMLAENCRIDYAMISEAIKFIQKFKKEQNDGN